MNDPLVSVIIGVYNKERFVRETIHSALAQTYPNIECIVVDDCSTDGSGAILQEFGDRIQLTTRETNSGHPGVARNQALRAAKGDYLAFLDADDLWHPEKIDRQLNYLRRAPESIGLCHTYCEVIDEAGAPQYVRHDKRLPPSGDCFKELISHCFISTSSVMIRREVLDQVGYMSEHANYRTGQDYQYFVRIARACDIGLLDQILASYRIIPDSHSHQNNWRSMPENVRVQLAMANEPEVYEGKVTRGYMQKIVCANCNKNALYWRYQKQSSKALWFAWMALRIDPFFGASWGNAAKALAKVLINR